MKRKRKKTKNPAPWQNPWYIKTHLPSESIYALHGWTDSWWSATAYIPVSRMVLLTRECSLWWGHSSLQFLSWCCVGWIGCWLIVFLHFQVNMGNSRAQAYAAFSSSGPGRVSLPQTLFASHIPDSILRLGFNVPQPIISALEAATSATICPTNVMPNNNLGELFTYQWNWRHISCIQLHSLWCMFHV